MLLGLAETPSFLDTTAADYAAPVLQVTMPPADAATDASSSDQSTVIGSYHVVRELGRGGMGVVHLATSGAQQVAIKVFGSGLKSPDLHQRFLAEREILSRLDHPNIARWLDGGMTDDRLPWFAMEFVDGAPITKHCEERRLPLGDRLKLFQRVCGAVSYAHTKLVIHRDLKPSNILVTVDGVPKLLDFGIAKLLSQNPMAAQTRAGQRLMTPEYAAPEQVLGAPVTAATDVYSLGAVLYEILSGQRAHRLNLRSPVEIVRVVRDVMPEPPSVVTTDVNARRSLKGKLDAIVLKALAKDPARRHASVDALSDELEKCRSRIS